MGSSSILLKNQKETNFYENEIVMIEKHITGNLHLFLL